MDYQNKRKYRKMKKKQKTKEKNMRAKREDQQAMKRAEQQAANLAYKFREKFIPLRKVKDGTEG